MKVDLVKLNQYVEDRWVSVQQHPTEELLIWNYTQNTQFDNHWDEVTMMCRGLITDLEGNIVQRPFGKFFNINQRPETMVENLPAETPHATVKMDGSLGIRYGTADGSSIATRGSFTSDQAVWATSWIQDFERCRLKYPYRPGYTYLFEIIYPENRIVVDYGERAECVLLAVVNIETGEEISHVGEGMRLGYNWADPIHFDSIEALVKKCEDLPGNEEGFVCRYSNGLRVKMKGAEYLRLHRIVTQLSARRIWECLSSGSRLEDWLDRIPDELFSWAKSVQSDLCVSYVDTTTRAHAAYEDVLGLSTRKGQALWLQEHYQEVMGLVFSLLDGKPIHEAIWKRLRPAHELPFMKEVESE